MTTTWTSTDGTHSVYTAWDGSETDEHWRTRHFEDVATQMKLHPPIH